MYNIHEILFSNLCLGAFRTDGKFDRDIFVGRKTRAQVNKKGSADTTRTRTPGARKNVRFA